MAHGYQALQQWNQWLSQHFLGASVIEEEASLLQKLLPTHYGKHAVLIGVPNQAALLASTALPTLSLLSPYTPKQSAMNTIESDLDELPLLTGSVDLVLLPHTLEFVDNPRQLLAEACRVIKPEGLIVVTGFHPYSVWGLRKRFNRTHAMPWAADFIQPNKIHNWLKLVDFQLETKHTMLYRPPFNTPSLYHKLHFLEQVGRCVPGMGSAYAIVARAKVIPLTPIKMKWKQQLDGIKIASTLPGHIAR